MKHKTYICCLYRVTHNPSITWLEHLQTSLSYLHYVFWCTIFLFSNVNIDCQYKCVLQQESDRYSIHTREISKVKQLYVKFYEYLKRKYTLRIIYTLT